MAASQQGAQQALSAARASYEKVTGNPLQDIGWLDEYAAEVARALGDVELLKQHFAGKALAEIEFDLIKAAIKTAEGGEERRELEQALQAIAALEALAAHDLATAQSNKAQLELLVDARDALLAATRGDLFKRLYDAAQALIEKGAWTHDEKCPLCENDFGASISAHIGGQLAQYTEAAAKATEIKDVWLASAGRKLLAAYETASALGIEAKERRFAGLDAKFASGEITKDDLATSISWSGDLVARAEEKLRSPAPR